MLALEIILMLCTSLVSGCKDGCRAVVETQLELALIESTEADWEYRRCLHEYCPPNAKTCVAAFPWLA